MIAEALAGRRVAVTGATGFLGTALVERLLRSVPGCEKSISALTRDDLRSFVGKYYIPNAAHLIVVGDIDAIKEQL